MLSIERVEKGEESNSIPRRFLLWTSRGQFLKSFIKREDDRNMGDWI